MKNLKAYKNEKGFTLVELIVVIVILAILAAILIPGLLKWIDKAKEEQYVLEARNIYLAVQEKVAEEYAKDSAADNRPGTGTGFAAMDCDELEKLASVKSLTSAVITYEGETWTIKKLETQFTSSDNKPITATLENGTWNITVGTTTP